MGNVLAGVDLFCCLSDYFRRVGISWPDVAAAKDAEVRHFSSGGTAVEGYALDVCPILHLVWKPISFRIRRAVIEPLPKQKVVGHRDDLFGVAAGARLLAERQARTDLKPHPKLPEDTRLWAALVQASGGVWGGCVYDVDKIVSFLERQS